MKLHMFRFVVLTLFIFGISACSTLPEELMSSNPDVQTNYSDWKMSVESSQELRLGGVIASVTNLKDKTRLEVVNLPIGLTGKPDIDQEPQGRFVAYVDGFADPVKFAEGRLITLLGNSDGKEAADVGDYHYEFPVMKAIGYHLWRIEERVLIHNDFGPATYSCRSFYCREITRGTQQGVVIQEVK
ncbi:starvation lipoprotein Slp [Vibrio zhanjiangensis]|uniref:Starvation lipoprotein Slp n=1 Tax=Vibrio zhanjiangensis TaxID=1046128 RepID=A0ABQ6F4G2_9VIBR|nr:Slp family lipoprotein [Vibrio zhanjiangensis]GLT19796.1 starvation lipoprotein Slp [Vibrio zhanjiangensis]